MLYSVTEGYTKEKKHKKNVTNLQVKVFQVRHRKTGPEKASRSTKIKELNHQ